MASINLTVQSGLYDPITKSYANLFNVASPFLPTDTNFFNDPPGYFSLVGVASYARATICNIELNLFRLRADKDFKVTLYVVYGGTNGPLSFWAYISPNGGATTLLGPKVINISAVAQEVPFRVANPTQSTSYSMVIYAVQPGEGFALNKIFIKPV